MPRDVVGDYGRRRARASDAIREKAQSRIVGFGLDEGVQMGPVISRKAARAS